MKRKILIFITILLLLNINTKVYSETTIYWSDIKEFFEKPYNILIAGIVIGGGAYLIYNNYYNEEKLIENRLKSVITIYLYDNKGDVIGSGSGVIINKNGISLTCAHLFTNSNFKNVKIKLNNGLMTEIDYIIKYDFEKDYVIFKLKGEDTFNSIPIDWFANIKAGQKVFALGSPFGVEKSFSTGYITNSSFQIVDKLEVIQHSVNLNHGNSGGPLLNSNWNLIGINVAINQKGQLISYSIPIKNIVNSIGTNKTSMTDFVKEIEKGKKFENIYYFVLGMSLCEDYIKENKYDEALDLYKALLKFDISIKLKENVIMKFLDVLLLKNDGEKFGKLFAALVIDNAEFALYYIISRDFVSLDLLSSIKNSINKNLYGLYGFMYIMADNAYFAKYYINKSLEENSFNINNQIYDAFYYFITKENDSIFKNYLIKMRELIIKKNKNEKIELTKISEDLLIFFEGLIYSLNENKTIAIEKYKMLKNRNEYLAKQLFNNIK